MSNLTPKCEVGPRLWVGPHPETDPADEGFSVLVLCAHQLQKVSFGVRTVGVPLTDDAFEIVKGDLERCRTAAEYVVQEIAAGARVLVTCVAGQNRSSWVAGRALIMLGIGIDEVVQRLEAQRSFANWFFKQDLRGEPS